MELCAPGMLFGLGHSGRRSVISFRARFQYEPSLAYLSGAGVGRLHVKVADFIALYWLHVCTVLFPVL